MNMARTARAAGDSGICHVMLRGSPTKDIRRRRVILTENRPLFTLSLDDSYRMINDKKEIEALDWYSHIKDKESIALIDEKLLGYYI